MLGSSLFYYQVQGRWTHLRSIETSDWPLGLIQITSTFSNSTAAWFAMLWPFNPISREAVLRGDDFLYESLQCESFGNLWFIEKTMKAHNSTANHLLAYRLNRSYENVLKKSYKLATNLPKHKIATNYHVIVLEIVKNMKQRSLIRSKPNIWVEPALSHGNSYIFYEVANSNEFVRSHSYTIFAKSYVFTSCTICMNLYEWPTPNPAPKPSRHWGLDKSYEWGRVNSYKFATS